MRTDLFKDLKYYNWKITTDKITKPQSFIQPNIPLNINLGKLNENYNRHKVDSVSPNSFINMIL